MEIVKGEKNGKNFKDRFHTCTSNEIFLFFEKNKLFRVKMFNFKNRNKRFFKRHTFILLQYE